MKEKLAVFAFSTLAVGAAGAARADCPDGVYTGPGPTLQATSTLCTDHAISSPSGVYTAELQDNGQFVVWRGSNTLINSNVAWQLSNASPTGGPGAFDAVMQSDGNFVVYGPNDPTKPFAITNTHQSGTDDYFASLNDDGSFTIHAGTPNNAGKQIYTNKVDNPVKELDLTEMNYDLDDATVHDIEPVAGLAALATNNTPGILKSPLKLTVEYTETETYSWKVAQSVSVNITSKGTFGVPGATAEESVGLTSTTSFENGGATENGQTVTFEAGIDLEVPAFTVYQAFIVGTESESDAPYTFAGTALYDGGQSADVSGSGVFDGVSTSLFQIEVECVSSPDNCQGESDFFLPIPAEPVPEPATWVLLGVGGFGLAFAGHRGRRRLAELSPVARD